LMPALLLADMGSCLLPRSLHPRCCGWAGCSQAMATLTRRGRSSEVSAHFQSMAQETRLAKAAVAHLRRRWSSRPSQTLSTKVFISDWSRNIDVPHVDGYRRRQRCRVLRASWFVISPHRLGEWPGCRRHARHHRQARCWQTDTAVGQSQSSGAQCSKQTGFPPRGRLRRIARTSSGCYLRLNVQHFAVAESIGRVSLLHRRL